MIDISQKPTYSNLKASFLEGIEFKNSFKTYMERKAAETVVDSGVATKLNQDLLYGAFVSAFTNPSTKLNIADKSSVTATAISRATHDKIFDEGKTIIANTFNYGAKAPEVCIMAWYDAISEWCINAAKANVGEKPPLEVIKGEINKLNSSLLKDSAYKEAKSNVFEQMKLWFPKNRNARPDYNVRLKIIEKNYMLNIKKAVDNIVSEMLH